MCINKSVTKLGDVARMNDKCLDMQKGIPVVKSTLSLTHIAQHPLRTSHSYRQEHISMSIFPR